MKRNEKRIIIKVGSSSLVKKDGSINKEKIELIIDTISKIIENGNKVILVTSGAIAVGVNMLGLKRKPQKIALKQACAALGQAKLIEEYQKVANGYNLLCSQILVNHDDFENRNRMMHLSNTMEELLDNNIIPIVNENDALAVEEIKVGDNDTLSALLVPMVGADLLVLASDIDGLFNKNPNEFEDAYKIDIVEHIDQSIEDMAGGAGSSVGTGGMGTKIKAARIATKANCDCAIINSDKLGLISDLIDEDDGLTSIGTIFRKEKNALKSKEHWIIFYSYAKGIVEIDKGAEEAINNSKSLLPSGIINVSGEFNKNNIVFIVNQNGLKIAKGITNFGSDTLKIIKGKQNSEIKKMITDCKDEVIHIDNLVFINGEDYGKLK